MTWSWNTILCALVKATSHKNIVSLFHFHYRCIMYWEVIKQGKETAELVSVYSPELLRGRITVSYDLLFPMQNSVFPFNIIVCPKSSQTFINLGWDNYT